MKILSVTYKARMCGVVLEKVEAPSTHPSVDKYVLQAENELLHIQVFLREIESEQALEMTINEFLKPLFERLSFDLEVEIGEPHLESKSTINSDGSEKSFLQDTVGFRCYLSAVIKPGPESIRRLIEFISETNSLMDIYIALFVFVIRQTNPVARFLLLYNILLAINGDRQASVDAYIIKQEPGVAQSQSPVQRRKETIYTRLRNEIAHSRKGSIPMETCREISANLSGFQSLVKAAILKIK